MGRADDGTLPHVQEAIFAALIDEAEGDIGGGAVGLGGLVELVEQLKVAGHDHDFADWACERSRVSVSVS